MKGRVFPQTDALSYIDNCFRA